MDKLANIALAAIAALAAGTTLADPWSELADVATRIDYGFHAEQPAMIEAAREALERSGADGAVRDYYRALAALRLATLDAAPPWARETLGECARRSSAEGDARGPAAAESLVLAAACALAAARVEPMRRLLLERRAAQALERAAALDARNPRLHLVRARTLANGSQSVPPAAAEALATAVEAFEARAGDAGPRWGEAEALALLAAARLAEGRVRDARDLVERALLIAPDYRYALALHDRILAGG